MARLWAPLVLAVVQVSRIMRWQKRAPQLFEINSKRAECGPVVLCPERPARSHFYCEGGILMASNRGLVYMGPGKVEVQSIDFPKLALGNRKCEHGVILKVVSTNICGSDQHMVRGRTTAPRGLVLGHEITGEVIETGRDVEFIKVGDLVSVPFNIACGRCRNCKERKTGICLNVNPARAGAAYGYVDMGGWASRIRDGALRGFQFAEIPGQGAGDGENSRPHMPFGYSAHRLSRGGDGGCWNGIDCLRGWRRAGGIGLRGGLPSARSGLCDRRRPEPGTPGAG